MPFRKRRTQGDQLLHLSSAETTFRRNWHHFSSLPHELTVAGFHRARPSTSLDESTKVLSYQIGILGLVLDYELEYSTLFLLVSTTL